MKIAATSNLIDRATSPRDLHEPAGQQGRRLKGLVFDLDGTLLTSSKTVSPAMQSLCRELRRRGVWISIASARPTWSVQKFARLIEADGPFCGLNGASIVGADGHLHSQTSLAPAIADILISRYRAVPGITLNVFSGDDWVVPGMDAHVEYEIVSLGAYPRISPSMTDVGSVQKILLMTTPAMASEIGAQLRATRPEVAVITSNPGFLEITARGIDKLVGVTLAAATVGLSPVELVACGDGDNDLALIAAAGHGIAMGHSPSQLKSAAETVSGSNDDDSLVRTLASLFDIESQKSLSQLK